jgi:hypothetical protein
MSIMPANGLSPTAQFFRGLSLVVANFLTWFWLYSFRLIYVNANPKGDGSEWVAAIPFALFYFALVVPAIRLGVRGKRTGLVTVLALAGVILNVLMTIEIARQSTNPFKF